MFNSLRERFHLKRPSRQYAPIYAVTLLLVFHTFIVAYINSSFLEQFISSAAVGTIYTIGSAMSVLIFLFVSRVLHQVGNYKMTMGLLFTNFCVVIGLTFANSLETAIPLFLAHLIIVPLIVFNIDVFLEEIIGDNEGSTGTNRGLLLSMMAIVGAFAPFVSGQVIDIEVNGFDNAYLISALTLVPIMIILMKYFRAFQDPLYPDLNVLEALRSFWIRKNIRAVFLAHFLLQIFFLFTVVYIPLYLTSEVGLSWQQFGVIMLFAQMAYVVFEFPAGKLADEYIGEKEIMAAGFLILAVCCSWFAFVDSNEVLPWIVLMFLTRVGAAFAEVTSESYFFKQTKGTDAQIISFFRIMRPLGFTLGTLIGSFALLYLPFNLVFIVLGLLLVPGILLALSIEDTK